MLLYFVAIFVRDVYIFEIQMKRCGFAFRYFENIYFFIYKCHARSAFSVHTFSMDFIEKSGFDSFSNHMIHNKSFYLL